MGMIWMSVLPLAASPSGEGGQQPGLLPNLVLFGLIFLVFYFLIIAPARKKQKRHAEMIGALKNGDKVVTQGGIHGTVVGVSEQVVQLRVAENVKLDFARSAIAGLQAVPGE